MLSLQEAKIVTGVHYTTKHTGKMEGMVSLSTSPLCNTLCRERSKNPNLVCSHCYAQRQMKMYKNLGKCLEKNSEILTTRELADNEIPNVNAIYFRFESFGDLINTTQVKNYFAICRKNKGTKFALWTKNPWIIDEAIKEGVKKPSNLQIVLSSPKLNVIACCNYNFVDKIFTVYDNDYIKEHNININCGAYKCLTCGKCYRKSRVKYIDEKLK